MGIFSFLFGKPVDKVSPAVRENTTAVDIHMRSIHSDIVRIGDFDFEYLYTSSEAISQSGNFGSVIYIRIESPVHEFVSTLPVDFPAIQEAIKQHQTQFSTLPDSLSKDKTRWLYFNMAKIFHVT